MSKVEIVGPKVLLQDTLSLIRDLGIFQIEPATFGFIEKGHEEHVRSFSLDEKTLFERLFLEDLRLKIDELISYLPRLKVRESYLDPLSVVESIRNLIEKHRDNLKDLVERREVLQKDLAEMEHFKTFMDAVAPLIDEARRAPDLDFIGFTIREPDMLGRFRDAISLITDWKYELLTERAADGTLVGLITVEKDISEKVRKSLSHQRVPEMTPPGSLTGASFAEKVAGAAKKMEEVRREILKIDRERERFSQRWMPIYLKVREWLDDRLGLLMASASVFETMMCFFINGWMPSTDVERLRRRLVDTFGGVVALEEKEMHEEDIERIPIALKNPPFFKPFEVFSRLLPLPAYTSYDPTPFLGIFVPVFFGMILGDAGYGIFLLAVSSFVLRKAAREIVRDACKILLICSLYSIFFGILYGEFFGDLPYRFLGLEPICIERRSAVVPMIYFAITLGAAHILLGFILGIISALRKRSGKEAAYKILSILVIVCLVVALASYFGLLSVALARPVIIVILFLAPLLFFTGGILAPLELLKSIGNIISYVRIMAIGLTSVLLAFVANRLAGLMGDAVIGALVASLLHMLNIVLGVFSPTIHALRLHYVEFFSKFIEHGGRKFEPLKRG